MTSWKQIILRRITYVLVMKWIRMKLVTIQSKLCVVKKEYFILNNVALFEIMRIFRSDMFCSGKHILYSQGFDFLQF